MKMNHYFKTSTVTAIILIFLLGASAVYSQDLELKKTEDKNETVKDEKTDGITSKDVTRWAILGGTAPAVFLFGLKTWEWGDRHDPISRNEGWFGEDTSFGGADKAGHFITHYIVQRAVYNIFDWTEDGQDQKWAYSLGTTMVVGFLIEVGDAYTSQYGFSKEDLIIDYAGLLVGAALDYSPILDGFFGFSFQYKPSQGYKDEFKKDKWLKYGLDLGNDYTGWQYMMNFKLAGFRNLGFDVPLPLRLISIDLGWYAKGYTHYDVGENARAKERDIFIGVSINSAQLLSEIWPSEHRNKLYTATHTLLEYYHLPYDEIPVPTRYVKDLNE